MDQDDGFDESMDLGDDVVDNILSGKNELTTHEIMDRDPEARKRRNFVMNLLHGKVGKNYYYFVYV